MNEMIRYGIISTASITGRFLKGLRLSGSGTAEVIASRSLEKAETAARQLAIPEYCDDYDSILLRDDIDAVYIPLINSLHYEYAKKALLAGKHAIVEKPLVMHAEEAAELAEIASSEHLFVTEAVKTPFLPLYEQIQRIIREQTYGRIRFMEFKQSYNSGPYLTGWNRQKEYGGGVLIGNEAYFFHMAELLGGQIRSVQGSASFGESGTEEQCILSALMENGVLASLSVSSRVLLNNGLTIHMDRGRIEIPDYWKADTAYIYQDELADTIKCPMESEFQYEIMHYHDCIRNGLSFSPITPVENSRRYIGYCEELYRSFEK